MVARNPTRTQIHGLVRQEWPGGGFWDGSNELSGLSAITKTAGGVCTMKTGRPVSIPPSVFAEVLRWHRQGFGVRRIARLLEDGLVFTTRSSERVCRLMRVNRRLRREWSRRLYEMKRWKSITCRMDDCAFSIYTINVDDDSQRYYDQWLSINQYVEVVETGTREAHIKIKLY